MQRRALTLIVSGTLGLGAALGLAACGDDDEDTEIAPVEIDDTATTTTEETTTEETTTEDESGDDSGGGIGY